MMPIEQITEQRLISVIGLGRAEDALPLARATLAGGLRAMEITLRTPAALDGVRRIREALPDVLIGAGTIIHPDQVDEVIEAGGQFGVAPGLNEVVVQRAHDRHLPFIPAVMTPTEIEKALALDCKLLKFFPAESLGGSATLKALSAPYAHTGVQFIPLGGIRPATMREYLALPVVAAVGGSWMSDPELVRAGEWGALTDRVREALAIIEQG